MPPLHQKLELGVSIAALIVAAVTAGFAWVSIVDLRNSQAVLTEYAINSDIRAFANDFSDRVNRQCLEDYASCTEVDQQKLDQSLGNLFNLHAAIFSQVDEIGLRSSFVDGIAKDFCNYFKIGYVEQYWDQRVAGGTYGPERQKVRKLWCQVE